MLATQDLEALESEFAGHIADYRISLARTTCVNTRLDIQAVLKRYSQYHFVIGRLLTFEYRFDMEWPEKEVLTWIRAEAKGSYRIVLSDLHSSKLFFATNDHTQAMAFRLRWE